MTVYNWDVDWINLVGPQGRKAVRAWKYSDYKALVELWAPHNGRRWISYYLVPYAGPGYFGDELLKAYDIGKRGLDKLMAEHKPIWALAGHKVNAFMKRAKLKSKCSCELTAMMNLGCKCGGV